MGTILIIVAVTAAMIAATALYVAAEFATVSARRARITQQAAAGDRLAKMLEPILNDSKQLDAYVAACQLGITASSLVLGYYGQSAIAELLAPSFSRFGNLQAAAAQSVSTTVVLITLTVLQVVLGELLPKSVAIRYPEATARFTIIPMRWSVTLFRPFIILFNGAGNLILRLMGVPPAGHHAHVHSPEEIELLMVESAKGGLLESDERQLLRNAFRVGDLTAAEVMVPRTQLITASVTTPLPDLLKLASESAYTRIPVYRDSIDDVVGFVHLKDLYRLYSEGNHNVQGVVRTAPFVPESKPAVEVWNLLRQEKSYVAFVFDEFGGTAGMLSMEDLLEEIFGELQDEYDEEVALIAPGPEGRTRLRADVLVSDVNESFDLELPTETANTIGGLMLALIGRSTRVGDEVEIDGTVLRVEAISGPSIREVSIQLPANTELRLSGELGGQSDE